MDISDKSHSFWRSEPAHKITLNPLTERLQEERISWPNSLLVQQAEESTGRVHHLVHMEEHAVQVEQRRLEARQKHTNGKFISFLCKSHSRQTF